MIDIIIPSYELYDRLEKCLKSIFNGQHEFNKVIVVDDDSSSQGTLEEYFGEMFPEVSFVRNKERTYFSGTVNHGLEHATSKYVLILNNDTEVVTPDCFNVMKQELEDWDVKLISARYWRQHPWGVGRELPGYAFMIEREFMESLGNLRQDGEFTHFNSDHNLRTQIKELGHKCAISTAIINHYGHASREFVPEELFVGFV